MGIRELGENALQVFIQHMDNYENNKDLASLETIKELVNDARIINGDSQGYGATSAVQSKAILMMWDERAGLSKDTAIRCFDLGLSEEELKRQDEEKDRAIKQSETWQSQGLCYYCGGQLGMFKKCKSCGKKK